MMFYVITILKVLLIVIPLLISVAYFTLAERKVLGAIQRRRGPNVVGVYGLTQPLADGLKLLWKESVMPGTADAFIFVLAPMFFFTMSLIGWAIIPFDEYSFLAKMNLGLLYLFAISSLSVYGVILSGWSSNSKYAFLGALRSTAQMVSYEVSLGFVLISIVLWVGSFELQQVIAAQQNIWFIIPFFPLFLMFFVSALAETNRHPFDLPEAEAELVSGYNVEYSAMSFALFSLGEYGNMLLMSALTSILFLGGWHAPCYLLSFIPGYIWFGIKISIFVVLFAVMRAALPRYRYDQLMDIGWKVFLPVSLGYFILMVFVILSFGFLPF